MLTVLVTGANRGIGLELCKQYAKRGDRVIGVCRTASEGLLALGCRVEAGVDVTSVSDLQGLHQRLGAATIDILINNAGVLAVETLEDMDIERIQLQWEINALGPLKTTLALLPHLKAGSKVGIITSRMGSLADNTSGGYYGYRMSKAAVNMAGVSLAHDLKDQGISVALLHPGFVRTDMTGHTGMIDPDEAAQGLIARLDGLRLSTSGHFWHSNGESLPW